MPNVQEIKGSRLYQELNEQEQGALNAFFDIQEGRLPSTPLFYNDKILPGQLLGAVIAAGGRIEGIDSLSASLIGYLTQYNLAGSLRSNAARFAETAHVFMDIRMAPLSDVNIAQLEDAVLNGESTVKQDDALYRLLVAARQSNKAVEVLVRLYFSHEVFRYICFSMVLKYEFGLTEVISKVLEGVDKKIIGEENVSDKVDSFVKLVGHPFSNAVFALEGIYEQHSEEREKVKDGMKMASLSLYEKLFDSGMDNPHVLNNAIDQLIVLSRFENEQAGPLLKKIIVNPDKANSKEWVEVHAKLALLGNAHSIDALQNLDVKNIYLSPHQKFLLCLSLAWVNLGAADFVRQRFQEKYKYVDKKLSPAHFYQKVEENEPFIVMDDTGLARNITIVNDSYYVESEPNTNHRLPFSFKYIFTKDGRWLDVDTFFDDEQIVGIIQNEGGFVTPETAPVYHIVDDQHRYYYVSSDKARAGIGLPNGKYNINDKLYEVTGSNYDGVTPILSSTSIPAPPKPTVTLSVHDLLLALYNVYPYLDGRLEEDIPTDDVFVDQAIRDLHARFGENVMPKEAIRGGFSLLKTKKREIAVGDLDFIDTDILDKLPMQTKILRWLRYHDVNWLGGERLVRYLVAWEKIADLSSVIEGFKSNSSNQIFNDFFIYVNHRWVLNFNNIKASPERANFYETFGAYLDGQSLQQRLGLMRIVKNDDKYRFLLRTNKRGDLWNALKVPNQTIYFFSDIKGVRTVEKRAGNLYVDGKEIGPEGLELNEAQYFWMPESNEVGELRPLTDYCNVEDGRLGRKHWSYSPIYYVISLDTTRKLHVVNSFEGVRLKNGTYWINGKYFKVTRSTYTGEPADLDKFDEGAVEVPSNMADFVMKFSDACRYFEITEGMTAEEARKKALRKVADIAQTGGVNDASATRPVAEADVKIANGHWDQIKRVLEKMKGNGSKLGVLLGLALAAATQARAEEKVIKEPTPVVERIKSAPAPQKQNIDDDSVVSSVSSEKIVISGLDQLETELLLAEPVEQPSVGVDELNVESVPALKPPIETYAYAGPLAGVAAFTGIASFGLAGIPSGLVSVPVSF